MKALVAAMALAALPVLAGTNNAESCDIGVTPAATLLLPYFEVDTAAAVGTGATTLFTITNTSRYPQIAHVTIWTDWAYPVLTFNLFLSGYDVQSIDLFDVILRGIVFGHAVEPGSVSSAEPGSAPWGNGSNPNFVLSGKNSVAATCTETGRRVISPELIVAVKNALTTGSGFQTSTGGCGTGAIGRNHGTVARGYLTVDVVSYCTTQFPTEANGAYFEGPNAAILFDNVLLGDYQQLGPSSRPFYSGQPAPTDATGAPMVHIRALPEGGSSGASGGAIVPTILPFTFYDRYTPAADRVADRRQPLPSLWTVRYIQGGTGGFATDLKIWREGVTRGLPSCSFSSSNRVSLNSALPLTSVVRFDEHENGFGMYGYYYSELVPPPPPLSAAADRISTTSTITFPPLTSTDVGGWMYINASTGSQSYDNFTYSACVSVLSAQRAGFANGSYCATAQPPLSGSRATSQSWIIPSLYGDAGAHRLGVDFDAAWLGNGCTPGETTANAITGKPTVLLCPYNRNNCGAGTVFQQPNP